MKLAVATNKLGILLQKIGRLPEAEARQREYENIVRQLLEQNESPDLLSHLAAALQWRASVLQEMGLPEQAECCLRENVAIRRRLAELTGEDGNDVASALSGHGALLQELGRLPEAMACRREQLEILRATSNAEKSENSTGEIATVLWELAGIQEKLGYYGEAKQSCNDLLALLQSQDAQERADFASWFPGTYATLADVCIANKEFEEAKKAALALAQLPQEHPEHDGYVDLYALKIFQLQGRIAAGEQCFNEASACFAEGIAAADRAVAAGQVEAGPWADALRYNLAKVLLDGRRNEAGAAIEVAIACSATRLEENAADTVAASFLARSLILKARMLLGHGAVEETLAIAGQARELLSPLAEKEWARREDLAECVYLLAEAHAAKGESEIAARLREQAAATLLRTEE